MQKLSLVLFLLFIANAASFASSLDSWQGEWGSWTKHKNKDVSWSEFSGASISISNCNEKDNTCTLSYENGSPKNQAHCGANEVKFTAAQDGKSGQFSFFKPSDYAKTDTHPCQMSLTLQDSNPPAIHATQTGDGCKYYCTPDVPKFVEQFPQKNKTPYVYYDKSWCYSSSGAEKFCLSPELITLRKDYEKKASNSDSGKHVNNYAKRRDWFESMVDECSLKKKLTQCMKEKLEKASADLDSGLKEIAANTAQQTKPGNKTDAAKAVDDLAGVYKVQFENGNVSGETYRSEDILELVKVDEHSLYFKAVLNFYNGHECGLNGIASFRATGEFIFDDADKTSDEKCELSIQKTGKNIVIQDLPGHSCKQYCGARGSFTDIKFPVSRKREIKYMERLKNSAEYKKSLEDYQTTKK